MATKKQKVYTFAKKKNKNMTKEQVLGIVRHALTAIGGLMTAIGFIWSVVDKNK